MLPLTEQFFQEGVVEGEAKGRAKGRAKGLTEGRITSLSRLLERRFGPLSPDTHFLLAVATPRELDEWTDRVLDAPTLEDVFGA